MKRLLFAGIVFLSLPALSQTKAGKIDTTKRAIFRLCDNHHYSVMHYFPKEQRAVNSTQKSACITPVIKRRLNLSAKELMKAGVTGVSY